MNERVDTSTEKNSGTGGRASRRDGIVGNCRALTALLDKIDRVAPTTLPVLVLGESGVGKERVARYVHDASNRASDPFVVVNCGAIPKDLVESSLFGFEKGSFTGASAVQKGKFELAHRGTLFLDEIGELPLEQQVKLLRVLQDGVIERIGGQPRAVDVRIVAATNRDVGPMLIEGRFREDLYYRISGLEVTLPPLRERGGDILLLADTILQHAIAKHGIERKRLSPEVRHVLLSYDWPGNVRQLERVIETAAVLCDGCVVDRDTVEEMIGRHRTAMTAARQIAERLLAERGRFTRADLRSGMAAALGRAPGKTQMFRILTAIERERLASPRRCGRSSYYVAFGRRGGA